MSLTGRALDHDFCLTSDDDSIFRFLRQAFRHLEVSAPPGAHAQRVSVDRAGPGTLVVRADGREVYEGDATPALARAVNLVNIGATRSAGEDPVLHCGAVAVDGRVIVLPGTPGAGKSTTSTALMLRGFDYVSDETGPIGPDGLVRPYPKPVVVGPGSWPSLAGAERGRVPFPGSLDAWYLDPTGWGSAVVTEPLPIGAVVAPEYRAGAPFELTPLSRAEATVVMSSNAFNMEDHGAGGILRVADAVVGVPCFRARFGDVDRLCDAIASVVHRW